MSAAFDFAIDPRVFSLTFTPGRPWPSVSKTGKHDDAVLVALSDVHGARVIPLQIIERCVVARPPAVCTSAPLMIIMSASVPEVTGDVATLDAQLAPVGPAVTAGGYTYRLSLSRRPGNKWVLIGRTTLISVN